MRQVCKAYKDGKTPATAIAAEPIRDKYSYPWCIAFNPRYPIVNMDALVKAVNELERTRHPPVMVPLIQEASFKDHAQNTISTTNESILEAPIKRKKANTSPPSHKKPKTSGNVYQI